MNYKYSLNIKIIYSACLVALVIFFLGLLVPAHAQDTIPVSVPPTITSLNNYTISDGLAINCLESGFIDSKGRIWLNPCQSTALGLGFSFFQFDGSKSMFYPFDQENVPNENATHIWKMLGQFPDGTYYGSSNEEDRYGNVFFLWHPETDKIEIQPLEESESLLAIGANTQNEVYALTAVVDSYRIYGKRSGKWEVIASIKLGLEKERLFYPPYDFIVQGDKAWFLHQADGLIKADLEKGTMKLYPWTQLGKGMKIETDRFALCCAAQSWKLTKTPHGDLLLYLGPLNGFFTFNPKSFEMRSHSHLNSLSSLPIENGEFLKVYFARDRFDNLLIVTGALVLGGGPQNDYRNLLAAIWGSDGSWTNISSIVEAERSDLMMNGLDWPDKFFGYNFHQEFGWISEEGIKILDIGPSSGITQYRVEKEKLIGLRSMAYLNEDQLLVNTDLEKLMILDLETGAPSVVHPKGMPKIWPLSKMIIRDSVVYASARRYKLLIFDIASAEYEEHIMGFLFSKFLFLDDTTLVISSNSGEIYSFNTDSKELTHLRPSAPNVRINSEVTDLKVMDEKILLISALNGLWRFDLKALELSNLKKINPLLGESILTISPKTNGELWLGTSKHGILKYNIQNNSLTRVSKVDGLSNNTVVGILTDDQGYHWVSTYSGINVLDASGKVLFALDETNGLNNNEFNRTSYLKLPDGKLAFGGIDGFNLLDPGRIVENLTKNNQKNIYLTSLKYYDRKIGTNRILSMTDEFKTSFPIPPEHNFIDINFALSSYVNTGKHSFAYRLIPASGSNENVGNIPWIDLGSNSHLILNSLPIGDYIIQVRGSDHHSNQTIKPLEIPISVNDFFYRKWWFYLLVSLPFLLFGIAWINKNASDKKRLEAEVVRRTTQIQKDKATIEKQAVQLKELDQTKSRFFTNISHEFRTPLTVILGMAEQITNPEHVKKLIRRNAKQLLGLINQILNLRKLESGSLPTQFIQGDVVAYLQYIIESFHSLGEDKEIDLKFETSHESLVLDYDPEKLLYIASNLLTNAIKFTPEGGVVKLSLESPTDINASYQFSVSDTGVGIPAEKLPHIFDRFYQVDDEVSRTGAGTGIGLTLVKELVNLLNGKISVESKTGKGTTFKVQLPLSNKATLEKAIPANILDFTPPETETGDQKHFKKAENEDLPTLLIVEDNPDVMEYLITCVESEYQLLFAKDGQEGIEKALESVPDIIISDVMMPKVDGFELCNTLKTDVRTSHIPIVLLTAKADIESRITGLQFGADAYLSKPFDKRELEVQLKNLLNLRQQLRERYANLENLESTEDATLKQEDEFILSVRTTILKNMAEDGFGVPELCKLTFMSRTQLHNKIKSLTNKSTSKLIRSVRMEKASQLLRETELSVSQVALEVGIDNLSYFSQIFTKEIGDSPNKYRENNKFEQ